MISARSSFGVVYVIAGTRNSLEIAYTSELCLVNIMVTKYELFVHFSII